MKQNLVISVKDNGQPSLSATCAVYLLISDNLAEVPQLKDMSYEENNSKLTSYLIIALVSVSTFFLTFIILMVAVRFCRRRKPRLLFDGAVAIPSAYFPPNYAEVEGAGTLRSSYNYDAYLTTGSRTSDFNFVRSYNDVTMAADQTLKRSPNEPSEQEGGNEGGSTDSALIVKSTDPGLFTIGVHSGEIRVQRDISESDAMKQNLVISVKDNGQLSLSATCTVYLLISDNLAEVPQLKDMSYEENNSKLTSYLIIALVSVSTFFLTFIILLVAVRFCRRRKPRLLFDGAVAIPSAYFPPNYAEVEGAGTLRSSYNYDAYLTTGSRTSDFNFVRSYNDVTVAADQPLKRSPNEPSEPEGGNDGGSTDCALIVKSTDPGLFTIGVHSGEIRVQRDISESDAMKQNLVISVKDNGQPSLSATCAVYLLISDNLAEVPQPKDMSYEENNSKLTSYLIIALVSVSTFFLTFIILMVAVRFCRRRKPRLLFDGAVAIPSAYFPPNYAEVEGAGTLRSSYNYDAYLTRGSRTSDFNFVRSYNDVTMAADQTLKRSPNEPSEQEGGNEGGSTDSALIVKSTDTGLFTIGVHSGEIRVQRDISESDAMKQNLVISVKDNGQPSLSATCAVYLLISDNLAEVPQLKDMYYEENNSKLTSYLIIALVSVSTFFLTFIILMVAVRFCRRRKPRLLFDGAVAIPSAYFPPNYAEVDGAGTLRSSYNYDAYLTTGSRTSDFNFVRSYNDVTMAADQTLKRSPNEPSEQEGGNDGGSTDSALVNRFFICI
ncbi:hypothetical protein SKAU_G00322830 [Synaphobranchus kaupii]|uniref:Cadherin cytoplasmic C-terminal domain-containing protein n=1 Tax=Synaphobranchus kaupii TaxID=118154 RepID=A0A9Q1EP67_SYNKA|nr:hypothetical protein SKAU_G00322830 [Synaphobranchus kaupii]